MGDSEVGFPDNDAVRDGDAVAMVSLAQVDAFAVEPCVPLVRKASSEFRPAYSLSNCQSSIAARSFTVKQRPEEKGDIFSINSSPQSSKIRPEWVPDAGGGPQ